MRDDHRGRPVTPLQPQHQLENGLALATVRVSCEYFQEIRAFDEITLRMSLASLAQNRVLMKFDYYRDQGEGEQLVARGEQEIACMRHQEGRMVPTPIPEEMRAAGFEYHGVGR